MLGPGRRRSRSFGTLPQSPRYLEGSHQTRTAMPMRRYLVHAAGIAAAYLAAALLLSFLQPARFPLPVFPSSGIALAALLVFGWGFWPAVWAAGFAFATYSILALGGPVGIQAYAAAAVIATGVVLQAGAGHRLILRVVGFPTPLDTPRDIGLFLGLGGPVACALGASISLFGLMGLDIVPGREWGLLWVGWWLGDAIGVLVGAPLTLILIARPRAIWRPRMLSVAPLLTVSTVLIASLMLQVGPLDVRQQHAAFRVES
ncbi:MAG: hypothetical protein FJ189_08830, partial [Gammaproteobacteria bacterium]|nr:hypothetical protein [Gammaproteobacteria bacterium]